MDRTYYVEIFTSKEVWEVNYETLSQRAAIKHWQDLVAEGWPARIVTP